MRPSFGLSLALALVVPLQSPLAAAPLPVQPAPPENGYSVENVVLHLGSAVDPSVTVDLDVIAKGSAPLDRLLADLYLLDADRNPLGQNGDPNPTPIKNGLHSHFAIPLHLAADGSCPRIHSQQLVIVDRDAAILDAFVVRPKIVPSTATGGCR